VFNGTVVLRTNSIHDHAASFSRRYLMQPAENRGRLAGLHGAANNAQLRRLCLGQYQIGEWLNVADPATGNTQSARMAGTKTYVAFQVISHAHANEVGGAKLMQERYGAHIVRGAGDQMENFEDEDST
jgi:hypothetical protein